MSRITWFYLAVAAAFGVGLWIIFAIGNHLRPPRDFNGDWAIDPLSNQFGVSASGASSSGSNRSNNDPGHEMTIEQSGQFIDVRVGGLGPLNLTLSSDDPGNLDNQWSDGTWNLSARPIAGTDAGRGEFEFSLTGPQAMHFQAHRPAAAPTTQS